MAQRSVAVFDLGGVVIDWNPPYLYRKLFDGKPLVPGVKSLLAHIHGDPQWARVAPPLSAFPAGDLGAAVTGYDAVRAKQVA